MKMIVGRFLVFFFCFVSFVSLHGQSDTIYFDGSAPDDPESNGSITKPFNEISDVTFSDNSIYKLKGGSSYNGFSLINLSNVTVSGYGDEYPVIRGISINGSRNITVKNLEVVVGGQWSKAVKVIVHY